METRVKQSIQEYGIDTEGLPLHPLLPTDKAGQIPTYNGIPIPEAVIQQLKMLTSVPISRLSRSDIEDAVIGFEGDATLLEDEHGTTLSDKLTKTWDEHEPHENQTWTGYHYWPEHSPSEPEKISDTDTCEKQKHPSNQLADFEPVTSFVERYLESIRHQALTTAL